MKELQDLTDLNDVKRVSERLIGCCSRTVRSSASRKVTTTTPASSPDHVRRTFFKKVFFKEVFFEKVFFKKYFTKTCFFKVLQGYLVHEKKCCQGTSFTRNKVLQGYLVHEKM